MSALGLRPLPLVAVVWRIPLVVEAMRAAFDGIADVRAFRSDGDARALLAALEPDALVVDAAVDADAAAAYSDERDIVVVHVDLEGRALNVRRDGRWEREDGDVSTDAIRNAFLRLTLGRRR